MKENDPELGAAEWKDGISWLFIVVVAVLVILGVLYAAGVIDKGRGQPDPWSEIE